MPSMPERMVVMLGAYDTKAVEYAYLRQRIVERGHAVLAINTGVLGETDLFPIDISAEQVAQAGGGKLSELRQSRDRGLAMKTMAQGAATILAKLWSEKKFNGAIGMGGTGGSSVVCTGFRALPLGVPKVCLSTAAAGDVSGYVGVKDIIMMPSIVDVAGLNRISRLMIARAADALCGMVEGNDPALSADDKPLIAASMFGNTTACVDACREALSADYEVLVFHATGTGGRTMESLVDEGLIAGVLDITTTEWADTLCGGVFDAGPDRLSAPGRQGIPHLIVPGCVDMVNFGSPQSVPAKYRQADRLFYEWNPNVTLMRTSVEENQRMGRIFAEKANAASGPVAVLIPLRGVSILDGDGQLFCDRQADQAMFDAIRSHLKADIPLVEVDANINDPAFVNKAVEMMQELMSHARQDTSISAY